MDWLLHPRFGLLSNFTTPETTFQKESERVSCELCVFVITPFGKGIVPYSSNKSRKILFSDKRFFSYFLCGIACQVFTCATCCLTWFIKAALFACRIEIFCTTVPLLQPWGGFGGFLCTSPAGYLAGLNLSLAGRILLSWCRLKAYFRTSRLRVPPRFKKRVSECHASFVRL